MQKGRCELLPDLPPRLSVESQAWPGGRDVRVTVRAPSSQPEDYAAPGLGQRKTLVVLDIVCLLVASVPFLVCEVGLVPPMRRGFYCNDSSIRYPLQRAETVSDTVLISVGILITSVSIALGESYRIHSLHLGSRSFIPNPYVAVLYKEIGAFLFGCTVGQSLTNMAKITVGRLRPHFLAVCRPDLALLNCSRGYVEEYACTAGPSQEKEARKSFYSGHASFAMYSMTYLVGISFRLPSPHPNGPFPLPGCLCPCGWQWRRAHCSLGELHKQFYLQARLTWRGARLLRPLLQFVLLLLALYTGLTRISDYWHHPSDVAVGFLQGALIAYWVAFHISGMFRHKPPASRLPPLCPDSPDSSGHTNC